MINVACPCLQPAQYRPAIAYCIKLGKSGTRRSPVCSRTGRSLRGHFLTAAVFCARRRCQGPESKKFRFLKFLRALDADEERGTIQAQGMASLFSRHGDGR
jgi:hypothetical protein